MEDHAQATPPPRSDWCTVCHKWQEYFEAYTFRHLSLNRGRLHDLDRIVTKNKRRRDSVRFIWFRIELAKYACDECIYMPANSELYE